MGKKKSRSEGGAGKGWRSRCLVGGGDRRGVGVRRAQEVAPQSCSAERYHVAEVFRGWLSLTELFSLDQEHVQNYNKNFFGREFTWPANATVIRRRACNGVSRLRHAPRLVPLLDLPSSPSKRPSQSWPPSSPQDATTASPPPACQRLLTEKERPLPNVWRRPPPHAPPPPPSAAARGSPSPPRLAPPPRRHCGLDALHGGGWWHPPPPLPPQTFSPPPSSPRGPPYHLAGAAVLPFVSKMGRGGGGGIGEEGGGPGDGVGRSGRQALLATPCRLRVAARTPPV